MDLTQALGWLAAGVAALWAVISRNRQALLLHAAEAVAFAEKYHWGAANDTLEQEAVRYFEAYWPAVPGALVRVLVRELCRRRKQRAEGLESGAL